MILANGCPKSGSNLLQKLCGILGFQDSCYALVAQHPEHPLQGRFFPEEQKKVTAPVHEILALDNRHFCHAHVTAGYRPQLAGHRVVTVFREPRNAAVSYVRWAERRNKGLKADEQGLIALLDGSHLGIPWAKFASWWLPWAQETGAFAIRFEVLCTPEGVAAVAAYLGRPCRDRGHAEELAKQLYGNGKLVEGREMYRTLSSWSGQWSDWREWWTPSVDRVWRNTGGPQLMDALGYE